MLPIPERIRTLATTARVARLSVDGTPSPAQGGVDDLGRPVLLVRPARTGLCLETALRGLLCLC
ncbi:hypothetical protein [Nonomuraea sp. NPDC048916]|uniref:hypothetical protein n=1 Tax=Nonomuraea sp. NPDC048916 TaxID=3154232 RepID=UPI0034028E4B